MKAEKPGDNLANICREMRRDIVRMGFAAGGEGAHMGGSLSIVEIAAVLYFRIMRRGANNSPHDRLILSKGHGVQALYAALHQLGVISDDELGSFKKDGTELTAHPAVNERFGFEFATGSLGQGLSLGIGQALAMRRRQDISRVFVVLGDGECDEGSVWEAALSAVQFELSNVVAIIDKNDLQYDDRTDSVLKIGNIATVWSDLGWDVAEGDGHDVDYLTRILSEPRSRPLALIAHTVKGKGISFMENEPTWHHNVLSKSLRDAAMKELEE